MRKAADSAFCWQSKAARRAIRDAFDATSNVSTALCVYDALTEIASDEQNETFTTTHAWISRLSGVSPTTIKKVLPVLRDLGLVAISTPALRAPSTYTLHAVANDSRSAANDRQPTANDSRSASSVRQREIFAPLATSEESQKNLRRITIAAPAKPVPAAKPVDPLFQTLAKIECGSTDGLTPTEAKRIAVALGEIKRACPGLTVDELQRRAANYRRLWPSASLTAQALKGHWAQCRGRDRQAARNQPEDTPPPRWRERLEAEYPGNQINEQQKGWDQVPQEIRAKLWPQLHANGHRHHAAA
ncbi:MAG: hypothetical protein H3C27_01120 [Opitutaceae bacterium]|nr:hypothetical protein [Opitutaceae bacterium]